MAGLVAYGTYVPSWRLDVGGRTRAVASYDEDATSMGVEAARAVLAATAVEPDVVVFATASPPYADKTNASTIHAALALPERVGAYDMAGAARSASGALRLALASSLSTLVVCSDVRTGRPGSADEAQGGDAAAAFVVAPASVAPALAEVLGAASSSVEFLDRWRAPGEVAARVWEERFGESAYVPAAEAAIADACKQAGVAADAADHVIVTGLHARAVRAVLRGTGAAPGAAADDLTCATGSEAFRNACYAVACGAYDVAVAVGVEKLKDSGFSGLVGAPAPTDGTQAATTAPAAFAFLEPAYRAKYGLDAAGMKEVISRIAWKNHRNGARNPKAQFRREVPMDTIRDAPLVAGNLGVFDCSGVSDGSAAVVLVRAEDAHRYTDTPLFVKALAFAAGPGRGLLDPAYDFTTFDEVVRTAEDAYAQAGVTDPRRELALAEVHDCFTPTELVLMEDLGFSGRGEAWRDVLDGTFDLDGELPVNPDGGLKSFGHPIGASGLRMLYECWLQLRGEAGDRQVDNGRTLALTHNLGGQPGRCVSFVSIVGRDRDER